VQRPSADRVREPPKDGLPRQSGQSYIPLPFWAFDARLCRRCNSGAAPMWCDRCRADAAAEVSADTGRASCGTCGNDLGTVRRPATEQARELLKRWSVGIDLVTADDGLVSGSPDPIPAEPESETAAKEAPASPKADVATAEKRRVQRRRPSAPAPSPAATAPPPRRRIDAPHPGHSIGGG